MRIGVCWPWLDQRPAPAETWRVLAALQPRVVRIASNIGDDLERILELDQLERVVVRAKLPRVPPGGWSGYRTGDQRPDLWAYREWPGEPTLLDTARRILAAGRPVDLELGNEPDLEWDEPIAAQPALWRAQAEDFVAWLARQLEQLRGEFAAERAAGRLRLVLPALSEGWEARHAVWLEQLEPLAALCDAVAVHAYTNGRPFEDPAWGGRPLQYAQRFPGRPLLLTETNDNGVADRRDSVGRGRVLGAYLRWLMAACPAVEAACIFQLPGGPSGEPWWDIDEPLAVALTDALGAQSSAPVASGPAPVAGGAGEGEELTRALDVSNWQGDLTDELELARREGVERIVVRLSLESDWHRQVATQQLRQVAAAGLELDGYVWVYWDWSPEATVDGALALAREAGVRLGCLWFDCEDGRPGRGVVEDWLARAVARAEAAGQACGIYTAAWWWTAEWGAGDSDGFRRLPLWRADYDGRAELETPGFGGWERDEGHQYAGGAVDRSVFRARRLPGGPAAELERRVNGLTQALAHLVDVVLAPLPGVHAEAVRIREQFLGPRPPA